MKTEPEKIQKVFQAVDQDIFHNLIQDLYLKIEETK